MSKYAPSPRLPKDIKALPVPDRLKTVAFGSDSSVQFPELVCAYKKLPDKRAEGGFAACDELLKPHSTSAATKYFDECMTIPHKISNGLSRLMGNPEWDAPSRQSLR